MSQQTGKTAARIISIIGHPLLTISLLVIYLAFQELEAKEAWITSLLILGGITLPVVIHNAWKTHKGVYTNFDVSNQKQRNSFFGFAISLLIIISLVCWLTDRSLALVHSMWLFGAMLVLFYCMNRKWKLSLHAAINFYVAVILLHFDFRLGMFVFCLAVIVAVSRTVLQRHTVWEVVLGGLLGMLTGWVNQSFFH